MFIAIATIIFLYMSKTKDMAPKTKVVALLELTGDGVTYEDKMVKHTLDFLYELNGFRVDIVDTESDKVKTLYFLDKYYDLGYRTFIGFSNSSVLQYVMPWFHNHRNDTIGISLTSTAISLNIENKNVIRLSSSDNLGVYFMNKFISMNKNYKQIYFVLSGDELVSNDIHQLLKDTIVDKNIILKSIKIKNFRDDSETANNINQLTSFFSNIKETESIIIPLILNTQEREIYLSLISNNIFKNKPIPDHLDTLGDEPMFSMANSDRFKNKYYFISVSNSLSLINREMKQLLGVENWSLNAYDAYNISRISSENRDKQKLLSLVDHLMSHSGILELNSFNDKKYSIYTIVQWSGTYWKGVRRCGNDPILGIFFADILESQELR